MIPGMYKSSDKPTAEFKTTIAKHEGAQARKNTSITDT